MQGALLHGIESHPWRYRNLSRVFRYRTRRPSRLPRSVKNAIAADTLAKFPRDFPVRLLPGIPAHQRQGLAHLLIGNNVRYGDCSSSTASALLLRLVKNGIAGPVAEVDEKQWCLSW